MLAVNKIISVINKAIGDAVKAVTCRILNGITSAMERIKGVAGDVISAIATAKAAAGAAMLLVQLLVRFLKLTSLH